MYSYVGKEGFYGCVEDTRGLYSCVENAGPLHCTVVWRRQGLYSSVEEAGPLQMCSGDIPWNFSRGGSARTVV